MRFELLTKGEVIGENRLNIFKKISPRAVGTDVVKSQLEHVFSAYWLHPYRVYYTTDYIWQIGVRLKVAFDEIKDEIIKEELSDNPYVVREENGVKVVLALEWLQEFITDEEKINNLNKLNHYGRLKRAEKIFTITSTKEVRGIYYESDVYAKVEDNWAKVSPIEWYYDEEANVLVSKKVLFLCPMAGFPGHDTKIFDIEKSRIEGFIHDKFATQATMNDAEKSCYFLPFSLYSYPYTEDLKRIFFWERYEERRKWRKGSLEKLKNASTQEGLSKIIEEILTINEEDEKLAASLKAYVNPSLYC